MRKRARADRALSLPNVDVSAAAPPKQPHDEMQAYRLRDHLWLLAAQWLRDEAPVFCAEDHQACEDLAGELASVAYGLTSAGCLVIEGKDEMKKRLGHSPDLADALCCSFGPSIARFKPVRTVPLRF